MDNILLILAGLVALALGYAGFRIGKGATQDAQAKVSQDAFKEALSALGDDTEAKLDAVESRFSDEGRMAPADVVNDFISRSK